MMKVRALIDKSQGQSVYWWRVLKPFEFMKKYSIDVDTLDLGEEVDEDTDILVLPKLHVKPDRQQEVEEYFNGIRSNGTLLVYDTDDDLWSPSYVQHLLQINNWSTSEEINAHITLIGKQIESTYWVMEQCDAITVSTQALVDLLRRKGVEKPIYVVKNAIDVQQFTANLQLVHGFRHPHFKTVGWAGGIRPVSELQPMLQAWHILARSHDDLRFVITGWYPPVIDEMSELKAKLIRVDWTDLENYGNGMQVDIGCCSTSASDFAQCKSTIKAWEFALADALPVCYGPAYKGTPFLLAESVEDWVNIIRYYANHLEHREMMLEQAKKEVKLYHDLAFEWLYWPDTYSKIINTLSKREDLETETVEV